MRLLSGRSQLVSENAPAWMQSVAGICAVVDPPGYGGCESFVFGALPVAAFMIIAIKVICFVVDREKP